MTTMSESALMRDWFDKRHREWENTVTDLEFEEWLKEREMDYFMKEQPINQHDDLNDVQDALTTAMSAINTVNKSRCGIEIDVNGHAVSISVGRGDACVDFTATMRRNNSIQVSSTVLKGVLREAARCIEVADDMLRTMTGVKLNAGKTLTAISDVVKLLDAER